MEEISYAGGGGSSKRRLSTRIVVFGGLFIVVLILLGSVIYFITRDKSPQEDEVTKSITLPAEEELTPTPVEEELEEDEEIDEENASPTPTEEAEEEVTISVQNGSGGSNFIDKAWDKVGGSPWLYKAWYTQGYSVNSDKCGRANPWLNPEEMADIVNAALALKNGHGETDRITPVTTSCWGGNPYSMEELRNNVPGSISSATSVSVSQADGSTSSVTINGISMSGDEFKKAFNLRAMLVIISLS